MLADSIQGERAIKLLLMDGFPSDNRFELKFCDGNDEGLDEAIVRFEDGHICTPTKRYPYSCLRKPDTELVITKSSTELDELLASLSTPYEIRLDALRSDFSRNNKSAS